VSAVNDQWAIAYQPAYNGQPTDVDAWWNNLNDETLTQLICLSRSQNLSLKELGCRVAEARYRRAVVAGNMYPQSQTFDGAYSKVKSSSNVPNFFSFPGVFEPDLYPESWQIGLQTSWELDFWGRYRRLIEAADANVGEIEAAYANALVILNADVAATFVELRSLESRLEIARQNIEIQKRTLQIANQQRQAGLGSAVDVAQATTILGQTESKVPSLEILRRQAIHRLCILLGRTPMDLSNELTATTGIPKPSPNLAFGIPADLLRRRPDVRQAERNLAAQSAKIGVAQAEFYPHISLTGSVGYTAEDFGKLFNSRSSTALISPGFSWKILNYGRLKNGVQAEKAAFHALGYAYEQSVLRAQQEVEDAQVAYILGFETQNALAKATNGAVVAVEKAEQAFQAGSIDYGRVYIVQADLLQQQDELVQAEANIVQSLIGVFKALGGGWESCANASLQTVVQSMPVIQQ
jgi:NodT family efflux transporter outer membrane factor (OMF) lipoprotein